jgi:uncharacterized protein CbrC (UPF0167 family)
LPGGKIGGDVAGPTALALCPCGGYKAFRYCTRVSLSEELYAVVCDWCDAEGPARRTAQEAMEAWNSEPGDDARGRGADDAEMGPLPGERP